MRTECNRRLRRQFQFKSLLPPAVARYRIYEWPPRFSKFRFVLNNESYPNRPLLCCQSKSIQTQLRCLFCVLSESSRNGVHESLRHFCPVLSRVCVCLFRLQNSSFTTFAQAKAPLGSIIMFMPWATARVGVLGMLGIITAVFVSVTWSYWIMARVSYTLEEDTISGVFSKGVTTCVRDRGEHVRGDVYTMCRVCTCDASKCASRVRFKCSFLHFRASQHVMFPDFQVRLLRRIEL